MSKQSINSTSRTYRLSLVLAHKLNQRSKELFISESKLVRDLLKAGLESMNGEVK